MAFAWWNFAEWRHFCGGAAVRWGQLVFQYYQVVIGYFLGYVAIMFVLLPLYCPTPITSIYNYLQQRFGRVSYRTGAIFLIISRTLGATASDVSGCQYLQLFMLGQDGVSFWGRLRRVHPVASFFVQKAGSKPLFIWIPCKPFYAAGACCLYFSHSVRWTWVLGGCTKNWVRQISHRYSILCHATSFFEASTGWSIYYHRHDGSGSGNDAKTSVWRHWWLRKTSFTLATVLLVVNFCFWLWVAYCICMPGKKTWISGRRPVSGIALEIICRQSLEWMIIGLISPCSKAA